MKETQSIELRNTEGQQIQVDNRTALQYLVFTSARNSQVFGRVFVKIHLFNPVREVGKFCNFNNRCLRSGSPERFGKCMRWPQQIALQFVSKNF